MMRFPNFLVVGASKTGTSWLHICCEEHPNIYVPIRKKEINFFSLHYDKSLSYYQEFFSPCRDEKAVGEISPSYMIYEEVPKRIYDWRTDVRLYFSLRHPIDRAYSHYCQNLRAGKVSEDVTNEVVPGSRFVDEGLYMSHIRRFLDYFPREQITVMLYEDLCADPKVFLECFYASLGVDPDFSPSLLHRRYHKTKTRPRCQRLHNAMAWYATKVSLSSWVGRRSVEFLKQKGYTDIIYRLNKGGPFPRMSRAHRSRLADIYAPDVKALGLWLGRDLSHWLV